MASSVKQLATYEMKELASYLVIWLNIELFDMKFKQLY